MSKIEVVREVLIFSKKEEHNGFIEEKEWARWQGRSSQGRDDKDGVVMGEDDKGGVVKGKLKT